MQRRLSDDENLGPEPEPDPDDVDTSEFSKDPRAATALAAIPKPKLPLPPPAPTGPPTPTKPAKPAKGVRTPKPPKGPRRRAGKGPGRAKGRRGRGAIVGKPVPPPPPAYRFTPGMKPPKAPAPVDARKPRQDPALVAVTTAGTMAVKATRQHPSGPAESAAAQMAAKAPANDVDAQAKAGHTDTMASAQPKEFSADAFYTAVKAALDKTSPKNFEEAKKLDAKAADMKSAVKGTVGSSKGDATADVETKAKQPPDPSVAVPKPEAPMTTTEIAEPAPVKASGAMPAPVPSEQMDFREQPAKVDQEMSEANVTEQQLKESNEPEFTGALAEKKDGEAQVDKAPAEIRAAEAGILTKARTEAATAEGTAISGAKGKVEDTLGQNAGNKDAAKDKDELARKAVADNVNKIYDTAKQEVDVILEGLDKKVDTAFEQGEARIRKEFTADWNRRLQAYKDRRYSGIRGKFRWVRDKWKGLPEAANKEYEASRRVYESKMDKLARELSTLVATELNAATRRIEKGRQDVAAYVGSLKGELAQVGQEAASAIADKFDDMDAGVKEKFDELASSISKKWSESRDAVNKEIEAAKEANKGLYDKIAGAIKGVLKTIANLKDLILNVISKAASVIGDIIRAPVKFLKNFMAAVKAGVSRFSKNIVSHLKKGLMGWLFGAIGVDGLEMPDSFDVKGMLKVVLHVLGITWASIRGSFVKHIGEPGVSALEKGSSIVQKLVTEGPMALWDLLLEKFTDFEDTVLGRIKEFVVEKVIQGGVTFLLSMLNPASAFIKACKMIYDIVRWLMDNGSRIMDLITTIVDSIVDIARAGVGGVPEKIENVLVKLLPLAIGFMASIIGMGGIGEKIRSIIDRVRNPITKAKDAVVKGIVKATKAIWQPAKKLFEKGKKAYEKGKEKVKAGVTKVKTKVKAGAQKVQEKLAKLFKKQEKPLAMSGASHTLKATPDRNGRFVVSMASDEDLLSRKIGMALAGLEENLAAAATTEERQQIQSQVKQLREIQAISVKLERDAAVAGKQQVLQPSGAPPGMAEAMTKLAKEIERYGAKNGAKDITKATAAAVTVDLRLLSKFGLPMPAYLQAQKVADSTGTPFDIRPTNLTAPKLLEEGAIPKSEDFKEKTLNEADLLLGAPQEHLGKAAWFLPPRPDKEVSDKLMAEAGGRKVAEMWWARWRQRKAEYYEFEPKMRKKLKENQLLIHEKVGSSGGVFKNALGGLPYTGDHDLYQIHGSTGPVIRGLEPAPFRLQHGAHVDWPRLPEVLRRGGFTTVEAGIYNDIIKKHAPTGSALLRINPKRAPSAVSSQTPATLPGAKAGGDGGVASGGEIDGRIVEAGPAPAGFAGLVAAEKRIAEENKKKDAGADGAKQGKKEKPFTMKGEQHHVIVDASTRGPDMASVRQKLSQKIGSSIGSFKKRQKVLEASSPQTGPQRVEIANLGDRVTDLKTLHKLASDIEKAQAQLRGATATAVLERVLDDALNRFCDRAANHGDRFHVKDIVPLNDVSPEEEAQIKDRAPDAHERPFAPVSRGGFDGKGLATKGKLAASADVEGHATKMERNIGARAATHPRALQACDVMAGAALRYLEGKAKGYADKEARINDLLRMTGSDNPAWSGSVGVEIDDVKAVFSHGNINERITHIESFNANILMPDIGTPNEADFQKHLASMATAQLNREAALARRERARGDSGEDVPYNGGMFHASLGAPSSPVVPEGADLRQQPQSRMESDRDQRKSERKVGDPGTEAGEAEQQLWKKKGWHEGEVVPHEEGMRKWMMNERNKWVAAHRKLSIPMGAGPSGSTSQYMQVGRVLGVGDAVGLRLACIAALVPTRHHTLVEVLTGAAAQGMPFTSGSRMYRDIRPMPESELRALAPREGDFAGLFPDEVAARVAAQARTPAPTR